MDHQRAKRANHGREPKASSSEAKDPIRLTHYSHGAGCGCKIAPNVLEEILALEEDSAPDYERLIVGNRARDDAAVYDLGDGTALVSTTDFFMPIVDDPAAFGRIAAANALSDVYAMGGTPTLALAILGWPVDRLPASAARDVVSGARAMCREAGIPLAGGHSIDNPEPLFGLAASGLVPLAHLKRNDTGRAGDLLFLTKGLGVGILTTAEKRGLLRRADAGRAAAQMQQLNRVGTTMGAIEAVHAMTDVTGFGLLGHLGEMCAGSNLAAEIYFDRVPLVTDLDPYLAQGSTPGGTDRNWQSYGGRVGPLTERQRSILCDPQTSGGLLIAADPHGEADVRRVLERAGLGAFTTPIGRLLESPAEGAVLHIR